MSEQNTEQSPEETEAHRMRQGQADAEGDDDVEGHLRTPGGRG